MDKNYRTHACKEVNDKTAGLHRTTPHGTPQWSVKDLAELVGVNIQELSGMLSAKNAPKPIGKAHSRHIKNTYNKDEFLRWYKSR